MKLKRIIIACLAMAVIFTTAVAVSALIGGGNEPVASHYPYDTDEPSVILDSRNGVIRGIHNMYDNDGEVIENFKKVVVSSDAYEGATMVFMIDKETVFVYGDMDKIKVGANIIGFFDPTLPMPTIYPPQYRIELVSVGHEDADDDIEYVYTSRNGVILEIHNIYDLDDNIIENMKRIVVSSDAYEGATMVFMIDEKTVFVYGDIDKLEVGANIRGFFDPALPRIDIYPPQYNMIYVSVGHKDVDGGYMPIAPPIHQLSDEEIREFMMIYDGALIKVNGKPITNRAFVSDNNRIMVPVREVAYGLDITPVTWFGDTRTVQLGIALSFTLDVDSYAFGRMAPIELGQAPILKGNLTYVPIDLFINPILRVQPTAYMLEYDEDSGERILNIFVYEEDDMGYNGIVESN